MLTSLGLCVEVINVFSIIPCERGKIILIKEVAETSYSWPNETADIEYFQQSRFRLSEQ